MKTINFSAKSVQLIVDNTEIDEMAASAAISLNPHVTWMKLVLTDDMPNANKQKIPRSEFPNILRTGVFMPLKMGYGEIKDGHDDSFPIGTFAHLKTEGNTIQALVALWDRERNSDVDLLKERYAEGKPIDVSWEVTYRREELDEEDSSATLFDVSMNGACVVGMPAYQGRTNVTALSSENKEQNNSSKQKGDNSDMDEEKYTSRIQELETEVSDLKEKLSDAENKIEEITPKYEELKEFKASYDAEQERLEKIQRIKNKFSESELKISDEYLNEKLDDFLAMSEEQLDFFVQEVSAFSAREDESEEDEEEGSASISITSSNIPDVRSKDATLTKKNLVEYMRENL